MNQAVSTLPGPAPFGLGDHQGPLTVTDNFAVLDDPVEQDTFTQRIEQPDGELAESVLMVQGMYCAACADTVESALLGLPGPAHAALGPFSHPHVDPGAGGGRARLPPAAHAAGPGHQ